MFSLSETDLSLEQKHYADNALQSGETLLWAGRPMCKLPLSVSVRALIMVGMAIFVLWNLEHTGFFRMLQHADAEASVLLCLPFLAIPGILCCVGVGSLLWYLYRLTHSFYFITDRRYVAVCLYPLLGFRQQEWTGTPLLVDAEEDGTGHIVMEYRERRYKGNVSRTPIGLLHIPNVERVWALTGGRGNADSPEEEKETETPDELKAVTPKARSVTKAAIFFTLAAGAWAYGLFSAVQTHEKLSSWAKTEGVVTSMERCTSHGGRHGSRNTTYRACYRFEVDGVRYEGKQSVASNPPSYHKGEKLTVRYNPAHPYESDVDSAFDLYFKSFGFAFVGGILFLIGITASVGWSRLKALACSRLRKG